MPIALKSFIQRRRPKTLAFLIAVEDEPHPEESQLYHPEDAEQYLLQAADGQHNFVQVKT